MKKKCMKQQLKKQTYMKKMEKHLKFSWYLLVCIHSVCSVGFTKRNQKSSVGNLAAITPEHVWLFFEQRWGRSYVQHRILYG